ncbi:hypothetical protein [Caballeronia grimmiae]|uniref:hypothetical protein n=1 Tax=Caballeronia grimmiae TaxID=1071679 RepID=UPI0038B98AA0
MTVVSISEAARLTGKSRKTIQRYVADGRISMSQHVAGSKGIDTSELVRVFGELSHPTPALSHETTSQSDAPDVAAALALLQAENALLKAQIEAKDANLADLRQSLRLLEHVPAKRRWWWSKP